MLPSLARVRSGFGNASDRDPDSPLPNGGVRTKDLVLRINRLTMDHMPAFFRHLQWMRAQNLLGREDASTLWSCMRKRVAELFGRVRLDDMHLAIGVLKDLHSDNDANGDNRDAPRRALEGRITYLVQHPGGAGSDPHVEFDALYLCHRYAASLVSDNLAACRVQEFAVERLARWIEAGSLVVLADRPSEVSVLVEKAPQLHQSLLIRLTSLTKQNLPPGQLHTYATLLSELERHNVHVLSDDLEGYITKFMRSSIDSWPRDRLLSELFHPSVRQLCSVNERIGKGVRTAFGRRLGKDILVLSNSFQKHSDVPKIKASFKEWTDLVKKAHGAQMMDFDIGTRHGVMDALSTCVERCLDALGGEAVEEVNRMQWSTMLLLGGPERARDVMTMARTI